MRYIIRAAALLLAAANTAGAAPEDPVPPVINYQGLLETAEGKPAPDDTYGMRFTLWEEPREGKAPVWAEPASPEETRPVEVQSGVFTVLLGSTVPLTPQVFAGQTLWLQTQVDGQVIGRRVPIVSVPYALRSSTSRTAESVPVDSIGTNEIADSSVLGEDLNVDGAQTGQALTYSGTEAGWAYPTAAGIQPPLNTSMGMNEPLVSLENTGLGAALISTSKHGDAGHFKTTGSGQALRVDGPITINGPQGMQIRMGADGITIGRSSGAATGTIRISQDGDIRISTEGMLQLEAFGISINGNSIDLESTTNTNIRTGASMQIQGAAVDVDASGSIDIDGSLVTIN